MLHDKDKHTSKCCPFLACCVLQFFLLTIYKPLLYNIDELQKWWSRSLISVKCTRAVYLLMRYRVISVKCINVCAGQINIWHPISLYTGIPVPLCRAAPAHRAVQLPSSFINPHSISRPEKKDEHLNATYHQVSVMKPNAPTKENAPLGDAAPQSCPEPPHFSQRPSGCCAETWAAPGISSQREMSFGVVSSWVQSMLFWHWSFIFVFLFLWFLYYDGFYIKEFFVCQEKKVCHSTVVDQLHSFDVDLRTFFMNLTAFVLLCIFPAAVIAECLLYTL